MAIDKQMKATVDELELNGLSFTDWTTLAWAYLALGRDHDFEVWE